jgi:hypothetical protein
MHARLSDDALGKESAGLKERDAYGNFKSRAAEAGRVWHD